MAFVVEDGSVVANANSLTSLAFATDYHTDRGHVAWNNLDSAIQQACLIKATDYCQKRYSRRWKGVKVTFLQSLDWPRMNVWDNQRLLLATSNTIPLKLQQAVCEYAFRASLIGELAPDPIPMVPRQDLTVAEPVFPTTFEGGAVKRSLKKVDVIEKSIIYERPSDVITANVGKSSLSNLVSVGDIPEYPAADLLVEDFLNPSGSRKLARG